LDTLILLLAVITALGGGAVAGYFLQQNISSKRNDRARTEAADILEEAEKQQKDIVLQAKEEAFKIRSSSETELKEIRVELGNMDRRLSNREENLERRSEDLELKARGLSDREVDVETLQTELKETKSKEIALLEQISGMSLVMQRIYC